MTVPEEVLAWAAERQRRREQRDFATADALRARIVAAGYEVADTRSGPVVTPLPLAVTAPADVPDHSGVPDAHDVSVLLLLERFGRGQPAWLRDDAARCLDGVLAHTAGHDVEVLVFDDGAGGPAAEWAAAAARADPRVASVHLAEPVGFGAARGLQHRMATGRIVLWLDTGVELTGSVFGALSAAFDDEAVGAAGKWGARVGESVHRFEAVGPPVEPHAVWGYLLALRRDLLRDGLVRVDPGYRFYRNADADVCLQVRATGHRLRLLDLPAVQHVHRGYDATPADVRKRESERNYRRLLGRWREDLNRLVAGG